MACSDIATATAISMSTPDTLGLLDLVQWLSPAFPTGAYAYSHGLEYAVAQGDVRTPGDLADWLGDVLAYGAGWNDAVLIGAALGGHDIDDLADIARAMASSAERLRETDEQGRAFALAHDAITGEDNGGLPLPLAFARAARATAVSPDRVITLFMHAFASNIVSCAVRFVPLGQAAGQGVLHGLHPLIADLSARAATAGLSALAFAAFRADMAAMAHETMDVRIFKT